jgi:hypothetical protein
MNVAIVGASADRSKFGNKAVRAYLSQGHRVFPVNPHAAVIEEIATFPSLAAIRDSASSNPVPLDRVSIYLPPALTEKILDEILRLSPLPKDIYVNPGAESDAVKRKAAALNLRVEFACSIRAIGEDPAHYP